MEEKALNLMELEAENPSILRDAIQEIVLMTDPVVHTDEYDNDYMLSKDGTDFVLIRPPIDIPDTLPVNSLDALVAVLKSEISNDNESPLYVFASAYNHVVCYTPPAERNIRVKLYEAVATDIPGWEHKDPLSFESAMIAMRTRFQHTPDVEYLLKLLSEISNGAQVTYNDNGIATTVVTQKGVALQFGSAIKPIVDLKPYRTFQEIEQPTGKFHIRVSERGIAFIEADGGMWKLTARQTIRDYLISELKDLIEAGKVIVTI